MMVAAPKEGRSQAILPVFNSMQRRLAGGSKPGSVRPLKR